MKYILASVLLLATGLAHAQSSSVATQSSASQSVAQGSISFSQTPADSHISETVRNVSGPVEGAFASSFSQMNCGSTTQGGFAIAGFSGIVGSSKDSHSCVLEVAAAETIRQSTVTADPAIKANLQSAATAIRCQLSDEVYQAYIAAGLDCKGLMPASMRDQQKTSGAAVVNQQPG